MTFALNRMMDLEVESLTGAAHGERSACARTGVTAIANEGWKRAWARACLDRTSPAWVTPKTLAQDFRPRLWPKTLVQDFGPRLVFKARGAHKWTFAL
jgi:hypothetical protein